MATVSVCMIVKNEQKVLQRCLESLKGLYEELIIVDTGSTTPKILLLPIQTKYMILYGQMTFLLQEILLSLYVHSNIFIL